VGEVASWVKDCPEHLVAMETGSPTRLLLVDADKIHPYFDFEVDDKVRDFTTESGTLVRGGLVTAVSGDGEHCVVFNEATTYAHVVHSSLISKK
jgi:hypothetical protein